MPHNFFRYGTTCLGHLEQITNKNNYRLINTYARNDAEKNIAVLIKAKPPSNAQQIEVECIYRDEKLNLIRADNKNLELKQTLYLDN